MSAKAVQEYDGKKMLAYWLPRAPPATGPNSRKPTANFVQPTMRMAHISFDTSLVISAGQQVFMEHVGLVLQQVEQLHPWLNQTRLVAKPDQLIKRRAKAGLLLLNKGWDEIKGWIAEHAGKHVVVDSVHGILKTFLVEQFVPHRMESEYYLSIQSDRVGDTILFTHEGGVEVGDVDSCAMRLQVRVGDPFPTPSHLKTLLTRGVPESKQPILVEFISRLYAVYVELHFTYLEINPLVVLEATQNHPDLVFYLDLAAKIDQTAEFEAGPKWNIARAQPLLSSSGGVSASASASASSGRPISPPAIALGTSAPTTATAAPTTTTATTNTTGKAVGPVPNALPTSSLSFATAAAAEGGPPLRFPAPFGRELTAEEAYVQELDSKTGASLKLTILNKDGRIWTMVAGGGASVVYSDAIAALGHANELANYGEYSGAPTEMQTYEYARTIIDLMTRSSTIHPKGKVLLIGGGIANFTNVASTFQGIIRALQEFKNLLIMHRVRIFVRRGGPNYQDGLKAMKQFGDSEGIETRVFGPETHITDIVPMALTGRSVPTVSEQAAMASDFGSLVVEDAQAAVAAILRGDAAKDDLGTSSSNISNNDSNNTRPVSPPGVLPYRGKTVTLNHRPMPFTTQTTCFVYGMQPRAVQGMLDFDYICKRSQPSVTCMIYPFGGAHIQKFYWGTKEMLLPIFTTLEEGLSKFPEVDTVLNFASCRSVFETTREILKFSNRIKTISIIAEGVPERRSRQLLWEAHKRKVMLVGPATVGAIKPGCFKIGNTGGMMDNIVAAKLYRPGSVAYISKSGGMSNELNNIISRTTNGVYEGMAIGGDRYPGSTFVDHMLRYEQDPQCKILVMLGEVGGIEEYKVCEAIRTGLIRKPVIAWCIGTCAKMFSTEVQFGHAGALAHSDLETADTKNRALAKSGAIVPETFEKLPLVLARLFQTMVQQGLIVVEPEPETPKIPIDYQWAQELGLVRKPASFVSTICDDRGQELLYAGMRISDVFKEDIGIGGVLSLLWFKRRLPAYACKFIEMVLMLTADHGPAVSGAHNTIVTARAGKDLVSSLCAGLLTIGDRFGGALDGAAEQFSLAYDKSLSPRDFVSSMRKQNKLILGIGHKIKSKANPDLRVEIIKSFAKQHFPSTPILDYALAVETITTAKKENLILNVDGAIGVLFVDLMRGCGGFTREESEENIKIGALNGLFIYGRTLGFIAHYLDQKRLRQGLYRHDISDIAYLTTLQEGETGR